MRGEEHHEPVRRFSTKPVMEVSTPQRRASKQLHVAPAPFRPSAAASLLSVPEPATDMRSASTSSLGRPASAVPTPIRTTPAVSSSSLARATTAAPTRTHEQADQALEVALQAYLPEYSAPRDALEHPEARHQARLAIVHELRRLRGFDAFTTDTLRALGREQLHDSLLGLENALLFMNQSDQSLLMQKNISKLVSRVQKDAADSVSRAQDGISKVLAAKTAISSTYYANIDSDEAAKTGATAVLHMLTQQPEVAAALEHIGADPKHQSLLSAIASLAALLRNTGPAELNGPLGAFTLHARGSRIVHPVWDMLDWGRPCTLLPGSNADLADTSALRAVNSIAVTDDFLFAACENGRIDVYDVTRKVPVVVQSLAKHDGAVLCVAADGNCLFSGGTDHAIVVWRYGLHLHPAPDAIDAPAAEQWELSHELHGHSGWVRALAFDENKLRLYSGSGAGRLVLQHIVMHCRRRDGARVGCAGLGLPVCAAAPPQLDSRPSPARRLSLCRIGRQAHLRSAATSPACH